MWFLRQSTASQEIPLGPFVNDEDGNTQETGLTIANTDIKLHKTGATAEANKNSGGATHIANGRYYAVLDATDTDTIGPLRVMVHVSGALAVWLDCCVLDEAVFDVLFGTTALSTYAGGAVASVTGNVGGNVSGSVGSISGVTFPSNFGSLGINVSGHVSRVTLTDTATTLTGHTAQTGDAYAIVNSGAHGNAALKSLIDAIDTVVNAVLVDTGTDLPATLATIAGYLDSEIAAIKAKTDNLPASPAATGDIPTANANADALLDRVAGVETNRTPRQALRLILAALVGKLSGAATTEVTIRDTNDSISRVVATVDADGNRSAVTLNAG